MIDKEKFLTSYNIEPEELKAAGLDWEELAAIYDDYLSVEGKLRSIGKDFVYDYLYDIERAGIHSYRYRTKDPGHLIEKIIRKRNEHFERFEDINRSNYHKYITDLIGIRVFFLYREDWIHFHKYITSVYENLIEIKSNGIYRSLHYIIKYKGYYVEIQGRTLFEEGWSEIDHDIVYPYFQDDEMLKDFSTLLNRLSGMADEMSSYFRRMKGVKEEWEKQLERYDDEG